MSCFVSWRRKEAAGLALGVFAALLLFIPVHAQGYRRPPMAYQPYQQTPQQAARSRVLMHLKNMSTAVIQYLQDYNNVYPAMKNAAEVKKALFPFIRSEAGFRNLATGRPYLPNPSLSHKTLASQTAPAHTVMFYEARPYSDHTRGVTFVDGHTLAVPEREWPRLKRASHIR